MAHMVESMMYAGEVPWHGLGKMVEQDLLSADAIQAAGLDWTVKLFPVVPATEDGASAGSVIEGYQAVVRETDGKGLGVVGGRYTPIQNAQAFDFFDSVVGQKAAMYHTAGSLDGGRRVWMLAKLPKDLHLANGEEIKQFLLLSNAHDGSGCLRMLFTPVRVVCNNTLTMALENTDNDGIRIRHTANAMTKLHEAQRALGLATAYYEEFQQNANRLLVTKFTDAQMEKVAEGLFPANDDGEVSTRSENTRAQVIDLFSNGRGIQPVRGTAWAAYNAVTEFADHHRATRAVGGADAQESKVASIWFGSSKAFKNTGLELIEKQIALAA
jgi:phage/plasmid-like protein (TIGR03299 family)